MTTKLSIENSRFSELDLMRFFAALAVLLYHYTFTGARILSTSSYEFDVITRYGYLGVDAFFMISGYVVPMSGIYRTPKAFLVSRGIRLYPAYWICCMLTFLYLRLNGSVLPGIPLPTMKVLVVNLTMLQEFLGEPNLNEVFWTLTYELGFYFVIFLIAVFKVWKHLLLIILIWLIYTFSVDINSRNAVTFFLIPKYSCCFIAGMLFYLLRTRYSSGWKIYSLLLLCFYINLKNDIVIMHSMNHFFDDVNAYKKWPVIAIVTGFYFLLWLSALEKFSSENLKNIAKLGKLTYPLYLIHGAGVAVFIFVGEKMNKYILLVVVTSSMIFLSYLIYKFVEKEIQRKFRTLIP